jgi:hypothetical protein
MRSRTAMIAIALTVAAVVVFAVTPVGNGGSGYRAAAGSVGAAA